MGRSGKWVLLARAPWCKNDPDVTGHSSWNELREGEGGGELGGGQATDSFKELRFKG